MKRFAQLFSELDATTSTAAKVQALQRYFAAAPPADAAWAVYFLAGGKPRQVVRTATLRALAREMAGIPDWLFEECYQAVGDLAETIAHVLPLGSAGGSTLGLAAWVEQRLLPLRGLPEAEVAARVRGYFQELDPQGRFLLVKLVGGGWRVGVSKLLVQRALAAHAGVDARRVAQRMMGYTDARSLPTPERLHALTHDAPGQPAEPGLPYPFFLAHQLDAPPADLALRLGPVADWQVEWKYDGIRGQIVRRAGQAWLWSRGEELVTERFPEIAAAAATLPDGCVLDGEILVWPDGAPQPAPFAPLQQRIGRKTLTRKLLAELPARFVAYDLLELDGADCRALPQRERRTLLERLLAGHPSLRLSPLVPGADWPALAAARARSREDGVEGLMLKHRDAAYGTGRTRQGGLWWKWKIDPMTVDAVLVYAQAGHGRRASVYTDYTFAVWSRTPRDAAEAQAVLDAIAARRPAEPGALQLVAFAKAYSGLTDEEFRRVDAVIRRTTLEKFGPVRSVRPSLVFELGFEGIARSPRHKSGIAVRFPRMLRIRGDKPLHEAGTLAELEALLPAAGVLR
ncbi:ATP-dependent DNA ligase [Pseudorhodoferax sp.]|uniref:ATP-dependent DNA ligase n=1 Tax=Pseudorhodoferax sp. TaxID=1993553 RepID=UPI0039E54CF4